MGESLINMNDTEPLGPRWSTSYSPETLFAALSAGSPKGANMTPEDLRKAADLLEAADFNSGFPRNADGHTTLAAGLRAMADAEPVACLWARNGHTACQATPQRPEICCGDYAKCHRACTPRGIWKAEQSRPQWVGLTDAEIVTVLGPFPKYHSEWTDDDFKNFARAVESALRAKNGGAA